MKVLYVTTIGTTMGFFKSFVKELIHEGNIVDIACNEEQSPVAPCYREWGCRVFPISTSRSPFSMGNLKAIGQLKALVEENQYEIVHCHTPLAAMATRFACIEARKRGVKVIYTAHGFHFYKGAPLKNWLLFYPVEKLCSRWTDVLVTINREDYALAQKKFRARQTSYVPGVGIDLERFTHNTVDKCKKRKEIGISEKSVLLLSVGELNKNKNQSVIVRALGQLKDKNIHYALAGEGSMEKSLVELAKTVGVENQVHFLGYRNDIPELCKSADIFCFPSFREGLGMAAIEAMACGLPIITSNVHGINDYSQDGITGCKASPNDVDGFAKAIVKLAYSDNKKISEFNHNYVQKYEISSINQKMHAIYQSVHNLK